MRKPWSARRKALTFSAVLIGCGVVAAAPSFAATQTITTLAGNGTAGSSGDGGSAVNAELNTPTGVAVDNVSGSLYIADTGNNKLRKVANPTAINIDTISTIAGTGTAGFSGDGGPATQARLSRPVGVAFDAHGNVFLTDTGNNRVREITGGVIKTIAGNGANCARFNQNGAKQNNGNGGPAVNATLCTPTGIVADNSGNVYVSDTGNNEVRVINTSTGTINAVAGKGSPGFSGDGAPATSALLNTPTGLARDALNDLFIGDTGNSVVRKVDTAGIISTYAGTPGKFGYSGDNGPATSSRLNAPTGLGEDTLGDLFISDTANQRLREVNAAGTIVTYAGTGQQGFSGDGGAATLAKLSLPTGNVAVLNSAVYFSDTGNQRVRGIFNGPPPVLPETDWAILLPIGGVALAGGLAFLTVRRRRSALV